MWKASVLCIAYVVAGCVEQPHTRAELVTMTREGRADSELKERIIAKDFDFVVSTFEAHGTSCLHKTVEHPGGPDPSNFPVVEQYTPELARRGNDRAEWGLHLDINGMPGYGMAADITREAPDRTRVVLYYGATKFGDIAEALWQWLDGRDAACPLD